MSKEIREQINKVKNWKQFNENFDVDNNKMRLVHTGYGYDFFIGMDNEGKSFYNIIPMGENEPTSGYYNSEWISKMKGVKNVFKTVEKEHNEIKKSIMDKLKDNDMENLLKKALDDAFIKLENQVPQTKKKTETISIQDVNPSQLLSFMKSNDIPNDAYFTGTDNGYDGWNDIVLAWEVDVPTTEKEKLEYKNRRFHDIAFKSVYDLLTPNGYKRISGQDRGRISYRKSSYASHIIMFDNNTVYEMYMDKDFNSLLEYYSMYFKKEG